MSSSGRRYEPDDERLYPMEGPYAPQDMRDPAPPRQYRAREPEETNSDFDAEAARNDYEEYQRHPREAQSREYHRPVRSFQDGDDIYESALRVTDARPLGEDPDPLLFRRRVVRQVEVPVTRRVRVPVVGTKIVPTVIERQIPVKKLVKKTAWEWVDEEYTEIVEEPAVREREVWVKKIIKEEYMKKVPQKRVRRVRKPTEVVQELDSYATVQVPASKTVQVPSFRMDEVQDTKLVEVEEYETYRMEPVRLEENVPEKDIQREYRDLGWVPNSRLSLSRGEQTYPVDSPEVQSLSEVAQYDELEREQQQGGQDRGEGSAEVDASKLMWRTTYDTYHNLPDRYSQSYTARPGRAYHDRDFDNEY